MLTVLLGLNDRGEILKLLEDRDFFFPKCNNILFPGTAWRCAALGWSACKNDAENPPVGPCRRSSGSSLVCSCCPMCMCDTTHARSAVHGLSTSEAPQQRYCRLLLIACRLAAFWEFLFHKFKKNQTLHQTSSLESLACCQS